MGLACKNPSGPQTCLGSTQALFLTSVPDFVAPVSEIKIERGWTPAGFNEVQYNLWLRRPPGTVANVGVVLSDTTPDPTPVFARAPNGAVSPTTVCTLKVGDTVEVLAHRPMGFGICRGSAGRYCIRGTTGHRSSLTRGCAA